MVPRITVARLVALTHIPEKPVHAFLRAQWGVSLTVEHRQARAVSSSRQNPHPNLLRLRAHTSGNAALQFLEEACQQQPAEKSAKGLAGV